MKKSENNSLEEKITYSRYGSRIRYVVKTEESWRRRRKIRRQQIARAKKELIKKNSKIKKPVRRRR